MDWQAIVAGFSNWRAPLIDGSWLLAIAGAGWLVHARLFRRLERRAESGGHSITNTLLHHGRGPLRLMLPLLAVLLLTPALDLPAHILLACRRLFNIAFIAAVAWLLVAGVFALRDLILSRYNVSARTNRAYCNAYDLPPPEGAEATQADAAQ